MMFKLLQFDHTADKHKRFQHIQVDADDAVAQPFAIGYELLQDLYDVGFQL